MRLRTAGHPLMDPFGIFKTVMNVNNADNPLTQGDVLLLWGGMDIGTKMYGQANNRFCSALHPTQRDLDEYALIHEAVNKNIPIIGICRGAQMLTIYTGGELIQHVNNHGRSHMMTCHDTGQVMKVNSAHHQVCQPVHPAEILASADGEEGFDQHGKPVPLTEIPEVILFPQINAIGIQFHPEWEDCPKEARDYCKEAIEEYLLQPVQAKEAA